MLYSLNQRPHHNQWRRAPTPSESTRFGPTPPSEDQRLWLSPVNPSIQERACKRNRPGTSTPLSSTQSALRAPSRPLKTTIHWCSSLTEEPTNQWSRRPAMNSITSRFQEWTPSSDQTASRKLTSCSPPNRMPSTSPTRSESCELPKRFALNRQQLSYVVFFKISLNCYYILIYFHLYRIKQY